MSTRRATYVTIDDLLDQVGSVDVFRWFMVTRSPESHLNFDLDAATEQDWQKNPVFYVQYAHARVASVFNHARERGIVVPAAWAETDLLPIGAPEELALVKTLLRYPPTVAGAARAFEPHRIAVYLYDLAAQLHAYHHLGTHTPAFRIVRPEEPAADARPARARAGGRPGSAERARAAGNHRSGVDVRSGSMMATRRLGRTHHEFRFGRRELVVIGAVFCLIASLVFAAGIVVGREMTRGKGVGPRGARRASIGSRSRKGCAGGDAPAKTAATRAEEKVTFYRTLTAPTQDLPQVGKPTIEERLVPKDRAAGPGGRSRAGARPGRADPPRPAPEVSQPAPEAPRAAPEPRTPKAAEVAPAPRPARVARAPAVTPGRPAPTQLAAAADDRGAGGVDGAGERLPEPAPSPRNYGSGWRPEASTHTSSPRSPRMAGPGTGSGSARTRPGATPSASRWSCGANGGSTPW